MAILTSNEKKVIKLLIKNGSINNTEICSKLKISKQAVGKIRKKLERNNIIRGYSIDLNLESLGINILNLTKLHPKTNNSNFNNEIKNLIDNQPRIIKAYKIIVSKPTVILLCGFNDLNKATLFVDNLSNNEHLAIEEVLIFKPDDVLKDSYYDLVNSILKNHNKDGS